MQLDIILRTHDQGPLHHRGEQFEDVPKAEIVGRCARSLAAAIEGVEGVGITVVDDHSSDETRELLASLFDTVEMLEGTGNKASFKRVLEIARESKADAVYLVEDDYLHHPGAIQELMATWEKFQVTSQIPFALCPADCPDNYGTREGHATRIVGGSDKPWRTVAHTGFTFMIAPTTLDYHWETFAYLARYWPNVKEEDSINKIWTNEVPMFTPLPSLAFHCSFDHPYFDHNALWDQHAPSLRLVKQG